MRAPLDALPTSVTLALASLWRRAPAFLPQLHLGHPPTAVNAERPAVEVRVVDDGQRELGELGRLAKARRVERRCEEALADPARGPEQERRGTCAIRIESEAKDLERSIGRDGQREEAKRESVRGLDYTLLPS